MTNRRYETRCDEEGLPKLVQHVRYNFGMMQFYVRLFDGEVLVVNSALCCPSLGIFGYPRDEEFQDVEQYVLKQFHHGLLAGFSI